MIRSLVSTNQNLARSIRTQHPSLASLTIVPKFGSIQNTTTPVLRATPNSVHHFSTSLTLKMPSSDPNKLNASGLTPAESKKLPKREPKSDEQQIIKAFREMYSSAPTSSSYDIYTQEAIFHDPVSIARGLPSIKAQFNALPALFPKAIVKQMDFLETPKEAPAHSVLIDQTVEWYKKEQDQEPVKTLNSLLTLIRDPSSGLITKHIEEWDHRAEVDSSNSGIMGTLNEYRKKTVAKLSEKTASQTPPTERGQ